MAETATNTTNSFLAPELLETNVPVMPKISSTGQLTSAGILDKLKTGAPIYEGERLPDVPKGMSARQFYSQFPSGAAVYSGFASSPTAKTPKYTGSIDFFDPTAPSDTSTPSDTVQGDVDSQMDAVLDLSGDNDIIDYSVTDDSEDAVDVSSLDTPETREDYTPLIGSQGTDTLTKAPEEFTINIALQNIDIPGIQEFLDGVEDKNLLTELGDTLETGFDNLSKGIEVGIDGFTKEVEEFAEQLGKFSDSPVSYVTNVISKEVNSLLDFLSNPEVIFSAETARSATEYAVKGVFSNVVSGFFSMMGLGPAAGPLGTLFTTMLFNSDTFSDFQIGQPGQYETLTKNADGTFSSTYTQTQVAYFDLYGVARDINGKQVLTPGPLYSTGGMGMYGKPTRFQSIPLAVHDVEGGAKTDPYGQNDLFADMPIDEDPTIDSPPDKYDPTMPEFDPNITPVEPSPPLEPVSPLGSFDEEYTFADMPEDEDPTSEYDSKITTDASVDTFGDAPEGDDSDSDSDGDGAGPGGEDTGGEGPGGGW